VDEGTVRAAGAPEVGGPIHLGAVGVRAAAKLANLTGRVRSLAHRVGYGSAARAAFQAESSAILGSSLDVRHVVEVAASLTIPRFGDGVMVFLAREAAEVLPGGVRARGGVSGLAPDAGEISLAAVVHRDPRFAEFMKVAEELRPTHVDDDFGPGLVVRTGQTWYLPYIPQWLEYLALPSELARTRYRDLRQGPTLVVAMPSRGRVLGCLLLTRSEGRYSDEEIALAEDFGRRAGMALDNALEYHRARESALTLQRSLLPAHPPALAGGEVAMEYLPGTAGTQVGGDLYDVIPLPDGRVGLAIGDVMGRGLGAAAQMGQLRAALRAFALSDTEPADLLAGLARVASSLDVSFATCLYGVYDPSSRLLRIASAGHFPPLLLIPGRPVGYADLEPGLCFGVDETVAGEITYEETAIDLPPGSAVLFFTDGLVESRRQPVDDGMEQLRAVLAGERPPPGAEAAIDLDLIGRDPGEPSLHPYPDPGLERGSELEPAGILAATDRPAYAWDASGTPAELVERVLEAAGSPELGDDDIAILVLATHAEAVTLVDTKLDAREDAPGKARSLLGDALVSHGLGALADDARLLVSEIVTNAVRHARSDLRLSAGLDGNRVRVDVEDREAGVWPRRIRPRNDDEFGRGLLIVDALSRSWGIETTAAGKRIWFDLVDNSGEDHGSPEPVASPLGAVGPAPRMPTHTAGARGTRRE
jgi:anti-sigma regulatory factor (Ser/Thr protein kinase)